MTVKITTPRSDDPEHERDPFAALWRGLKQRCPSCGTGRLFSSYLKVADTCPACSEELHHHRADDAPPYFTIFIVGHLVVAGILIVEDIWAPESWVHALIWTPVIIAMSLALLPPIKGALVGVQWANRMHGFSGQDDDPAAPGQID